MRDQILPFARGETRAYARAVRRHEQTYGPSPDEHQVRDAAARKSGLDKEERDWLCQGFFEAMLRPPQRRGR